MDVRRLPMRVAGVGAVSPAGWGLASMVEAVLAGRPLAHEVIQRAPGAVVQRIRRVPRPAAPLPAARDPRMRRTSPVTAFAVAAAMEALGTDRVSEIRSGRWRLGVLTVMFNGCVGFSRRFYGEVLENSATASPLIFPETVFNAPSSHLAALLGATEANDTLVGDTAQFPAAIDTAALWLEKAAVDGVLIVAAEEIDWLSAEAAGLIDRESVVAEGAAALYFEPAPTPHVLWQPPVPVGPSHPRSAAAHRVRAIWRSAVAEDESGILLCDGLTGARCADAAESAAFADWTGPRLSAGLVLGDAFGVRAAWQCALAADAVATGAAMRTLVPAIGTNQQALGVGFLGPDSSMP